MAADPDLCRTGQLPALSPVNGPYGISELHALARLDLYKRNRPISLGNQIDIPVSAAEAALQNAPTVMAEPSLRNPLAHFSPCLRLCRHGAQGMQLAPAIIIDCLRVSSNRCKPNPSDSPDRV
jgi:hypothetical protein